MTQHRIKIEIVLIISIILFSSCNKIKLPQVDYASHLEDYHLYEILNYYEGNLRLNDSVIDDFMNFNIKSREKLPELDYSKRWIYGIAIDKRTPYHEIDSIFRILEKTWNYQVFLLVNNIKDTSGFIMPIPLYSHALPGNFPDTLLLDNLIELKKGIVYINGRQAIGEQIDRKIKEIVFKKEQVDLCIDNSTEYDSFIKILSHYHMYRQHFKELYAELKFNKKYSWFYKLPKYFSEIKKKVDEEYNSKIYLFDNKRFSDKTILVDNE